MGEVRVAMLCLCTRKAPTDVLRRSRLVFGTLLLWSRPHSMLRASRKKSRCAPKIKAKAKRPQFIDASLPFPLPPFLPASAACLLDLWSQRLYFWLHVCNSRRSLFLLSLTPPLLQQRSPPHKTSQTHRHPLSPLHPRSVVTLVDAMHACRRERS